MTKRIAYFEYGRVYPAPEGAPANGAPLARGNPPIAPERESESKYTPSRLHPCVVLATLWYIAFAAIIGACIISQLSSPSAPELWPPHPLEIAIVLTAEFALWVITLALHRCARRNLAGLEDK